MMRQVVSASSNEGVFLINLDPHSELLVLIAHRLDRLFVSQQPLIDSHRKRLLKRLRIADRHVDLELSKAGPPKTFDESRLIAVRSPAYIEPPIRRTGVSAAQIVRFNDERVSLPVADRVSVPPGLRLALRRKLPAIGVDVAN